MLEPNDIEFFLSGGPANTDPNASLGGDYSNTQVSATINNLFNNVSTADSINGIVDYRCIYVFNHGPDYGDWMFDTDIWFDLQQNSPAQLELGVTAADDEQVINVNGTPSGGYITITYTDLIGDSYTTTNISWSGTATAFATAIANAINELAPIVGGVTCSADQQTGYFKILVTFGGDDGNKLHNLITVQNNLTGITSSAVSTSKIVDGSPINTQAISVGTSTTAPDGIVFTLSSLTNKLRIGTLQRDDGFPIWIKRTIPANTNPSVLAGATIKLNGKVFPVGPTPKPTQPPTPTPTPTATPLPVGAGVFAWGRNNFGQLGVGFSSNYEKSPIQFYNAPSAWTVFGRLASSAFGVQSNYSLWSWGNNGSGQLGLGDVNFRSSPTNVSSPAVEWAVAHSGDSFSVALSRIGNLYTAGYNNYGQLANNTTASQSNFVQIPNNGAAWVKIDVGPSFVAGIKTDSSLWVWGENTAGNLGTYNTEHYSSPVQTIFATNDWAQITCGFGTMAAIKTNGSLYAWGSNNYGQVGNGNRYDLISSPIQIGTNTNWSQVSMGRSHTLAIKNDGSLWGWGRNSEGQLGLNDLNNRSSPVQLAAGATWISAGGYNSAFVDGAGQLLVAGANDKGQLGLEDINARLVFTIVPLTITVNSVHVGYDFMIAR